MKKIFSVAIDGPSGVGKSTLARGLSKRLGFMYVDTGAMFRTFAVYFIDKGIKAEEEEAIVKALNDIDIDIKYIGGTQHMLLNGTDVTDKLRTEDVSRMASVSSQYKKVRERLLALQRKLARDNDVVMDGRDIGTVVLPNADLKIFLTAAPKIRAGRRYEELKLNGRLNGASLSDIEKDIEERDYRDSHREIAPLKPADDSFMLDNSDMSIEEVENRIIEEISKRRNA